MWFNSPSAPASFPPPLPCPSLSLTFAIIQTPLAPQSLIRTTTHPLLPPPPSPLLSPAGTATTALTFSPVSGQYPSMGGAAVRFLSTLEGRSVVWHRMWRYDRMPLGDLPSTGKCVAAVVILCDWRFDWHDCHLLKFYACLSLFFCQQLFFLFNHRALQSFISVFCLIFKGIFCTCL